jgi:hypothetical protein
MQGFRNRPDVQQILETHAAVYKAFNIQRLLLSSRANRILRARSESVWNMAVA